MWGERNALSIQYTMHLHKSERRKMKKNIFIHIFWSLFVIIQTTRCFYLVWLFKRTAETGTVFALSTNFLVTKTGKKRGTSIATKRFNFVSLENHINFVCSFIRWTNQMWQLEFSAAVKTIGKCEINSPINSPNSFRRFLVAQVS